MTAFQQIAFLLTIIWLVMVVVRFRRSNVVLIGGLVAIGSYALAAFAFGEVTAMDLGLGRTNSWLPAMGLALVWLGLMILYTPIADGLAARWFDKPPTLETFHGLQQSKGKLIAGIAVAWVLGGILEELIFRGIVLQSVESALTAWLSVPMAAAVAVCTAAFGAGLIHLYQGPRAAVAITQLSVLFGVLLVLSGHNLWAVMVCHGLYDTIAFVRFANKKSKYSNLNGEEGLAR